ncbi:MAG: hypothetical protein ACTSX6_13150 [Candidatus Heimdallarchaeaceae archaeon]
MGIIYRVKRIIRRLLGQVIEQEIEQRGRQLLNKKTGTYQSVEGKTTSGTTSTSQTVPSGRGAGVAGIPFNPLATTKEQLVTAWPAMPKEVKEQMLNNKNSFGRLPDEIKKQLLQINRKKGEDPTATPQEKKVIEEAIDYLAKQK